MSRLPKPFWLVRLKARKPEVLNTHPGLAVLDRVCFPTDTPCVIDNMTQCWVVMEAMPDGSQKTVAFATLVVDPKKNEAHLSRCGVHPERRGQGLQRALIDARIRWAKAHGFKAVRTYISGPENPCGGENSHSGVNLRKCGFRGRKSKDGQWIFFRLGL